MGKVEKQIVSLLQNSEKPLTLDEIADQIGKPSKTVFKSLRKLFEKEQIECDNRTRQYKIAEK